VQQLASLTHACITHYARQGGHNQLFCHLLQGLWELICVLMLPMPCTGAFVQGSSVLSWVGNNTAKLQLQHGAPYSNMQCWTLISTNSYGQVRSAALRKTAYTAKSMRLQAFGVVPCFRAELLPGHRSSTCPAVSTI